MTHKTNSKKPNRKKVVVQKKITNVPDYTFLNPTEPLIITAPLPLVQINQKFNWLSVRWLIVVSGCLLVGLAILSGWWWQITDHKSQITNQKSINTNITIGNNINVGTNSELNAIAPLTGQLVSTETATRRPWAVVVENFPAVRPQAGLSSADVVFEAPTEGGITRFLAIFQSALPIRVGPIRSARPYFNDWTRTFMAFYSHSGGTSEALTQLKKGYGNLQDVNEFFNEYAYERDHTKLPPHNLFTGVERFWNYVTNRGWTINQPTPSFKFSNVISLAPATTITIPYTPKEYQVTWNYLPITSTYERYLNKIIQTDANTGEPLKYHNVIVLLTDITPILNDPLLRINIRTLGTGKAILFSRGFKYTGRWIKLHLDSPLSFVNDNNESLPLEIGQTWISVLEATRGGEIIVN